MAMVADSWQIAAARHQGCLERLDFERARIEVIEEGAASHCFTVTMIAAMPTIEPMAVQNARRAPSRV